MRIKLEINDLVKENDENSRLDMIVRENMTIGSLKKALEVPEKYTERIMVNGVKRSEYYSLNPGDEVIFEPEVDSKEEEKVEDEETLKSEIE